MADPIPSAVFERELGQITIRELFSTGGDGSYLDFDATEDRSQTQKKYRIPIHQRFNRWSSDDKQSLIASIFLNYIIGNISLSRHPNNAMDFYFNIEDGQSRLTVIQEFIEDKFKFNSLLFSELTEYDRNRFMDYKFSTDITTPSRNRGNSNMLLDDHYFVNFDRINKGASLSDNDKYWCYKSKKLVEIAINLIEDSKLDYTFMGVSKFGGKDKNGKEERKPLEEFVTFISALVNNIYKKSYDRNSEYLDVKKSNGQPYSQIDIDYIYGFMEFYKSIHDTMLEQMPPRQREKVNVHFNNPGKFLGMIVMDYKEYSPLEDKKNMWVNILNINRSSDNFMKEKNTLWNGFTDANKKNQEEENIRMRLNRVKEFYSNKQETSDNYHIEYNENLSD
ncbi:MAG: hypothetical protein CMK44_01415 [Porticoccus sp.]|nr:hypothetical protein [Porticoccus sp.]